MVGGRDRLAGGSWAVTNTRTGVSALVLNRPQRRVAAPGVPSRGVLPLLAVAQGADWPEHVELAGMASFALVLVAPEALVLWTFDGQDLERTELPEGTHLITSGGAEDGKAGRYLAGFQAEDDWINLVRAVQPADDAASLVVRHQDGDRVFGTVFGQLTTTQLGSCTLAFSRAPSSAARWIQRSWGASGQPAS